MNEEYILMLAERGFSYRCISRKTGFTKEHIKYILNKSHLRLKDYRDGDSKFATQVIKRLRIR